MTRPREQRVSGTAMAAVMLLVYANVSMYSLSIVFALALMVTSLALLRERQRLTISPATLMWGLTILVVLVDNRYHMIDASIRYVALVALALMLGASGSWQKSYLATMKLVSTVHVVASIVLLYTPGLYPRVIEVLFPPDRQSQLLGWYEMGYATGLATHYSQNGVFLSIAFGIAFCMFLAAAPSEKRRRLLFLLVGMFALLISGKRGPFLFSLASAAVVYYLAVPRNRISRGVTVLGVAAALLGLMATYGAEVASSLGTVSRLLGTSLGAADITGGRLPLYQYAWEWFRSAPIFGIGWLEYPLRINYTVIGTIYGFGSNMYAHNIYLQLLCETGVVGFLVFLGAFAVTLRQTTKLLSSGAGDRMLLQVALYVQVFFLLYGLTGNPLYDSSALVPYLLSAATVFWMWNKRSQTCV